MRYFTRLIFFLLLAAICVPFAVKAVTIDNPLRYQDFPTLINKIIDVIFSLALVVAPVVIIIAGFFYITAVGDPAKIQTAKQIILYTVIGLVIVISAKGIIELFQTIFVKE